MKSSRSAGAPSRLNTIFSAAARLAAIVVAEVIVVCVP
jgi:hypothetical protein